MKKSVLVSVVVLAGCRIHFDPTADTGADAADAPTDPCATALICDDFDDGIPTPSGMAQHDPTGGRDGAGALRTEAGASETAYVRYTLSPPVTTGTLYARAHVKVAAGSPIQSFAVLLQLDNAVETMGFEKISADLTTSDRFAVAGPFAGVSAVTTTAVTRDQWFCLELAISVDANTAGNVDLSIAGERLYSSGPALTMPPGGFSRAVLGLSLSGSEPATLVWFDDFIVTSAIAGC